MSSADDRYIEALEAKVKVLEAKVGELTDFAVALEDKCDPSSTMCSKCDRLFCPAFEQRDHTLPCGAFCRVTGGS